MTALRSTGAASPADGRARFSRLLTIFAARNVCRSIFSSSCVFGILRIGAIEQHLREARDAGERRVHLVRDARREQPDRRHLLGQPQLLLEVRAIGDVFEHDDPAGVAAVGVERRDADVDRGGPTRRRRRAAPPTPDAASSHRGHRGGRPAGFRRTAC